MSIFLPNGRNLTSKYSEVKGFLILSVAQPYDMGTKITSKTGISLLLGTAIVLGACLFCAGCLSASPDADVGDGSGNETRTVTALPGTAWVLTAFANGSNGMTSLIEETEITLVFDEDGSIAGSAGLNNYFTTYETEADALTFGPCGTTLMAGPEDVMNQESTYLALLAETASFGIDGDELHLFNADGEEILVFVKAPEPIDVSLTGTTWVLESYLGGSDAVSSVIAGTTITLVFDEDGGIAGSAGCNNYFASYEADANTLTVGPVGATKMFCDDPVGTMNQENAYLSLLASVTGYTIGGEHLTLEDEAGTPLLTFTTVAQ